jgi:hypothetical protein
MLFLLSNIIPILCNPAPDPRCQVWVKISLRGGVGGVQVKVKPWEESPRAYCFMQLDQEAEFQVGWEVLMAISTRMHCAR